MPEQKLPNNLYPHALTPAERYERDKERLVAKETRLPRHIARTSSLLLTSLLAALLLTIRYASALINSNIISGIFILSLLVVILIFGTYWIFSYIDKIHYQTGITARPLFVGFILLVLSSYVLTSILNINIFKASEISLLVYCAVILLVLIFLSTKLINRQQAQVN